LKTCEEAEIALFVSLEGLLRSIPAVEALHILAQLPLIVRDELRTFAVGPDTSVHAGGIERELRAKLQLSEVEAATTLSSICHLIANSISSSLVAKLQAELPADMRGLFAPS
jgi:uncharacterized protein (DUF2267 family)